MLNTRDEQHTLSQPTRRRANTANGKEGLKHASTLRYIQNTGQGQRGEDMLRPRSKAMRAEMQQHTESAHKTCIPETTTRANAETHLFFFFFWNLQDQKVHRYFGSSQLGTSRNQPLCSTPEMSNTRYHSLPDAGQTRQMARRGSNMPPH